MTRPMSHGSHEAAVQNGPASEEPRPPMRMTASWFGYLLTGFHRIQGRGGRWSLPHWQARLRSHVVSRASCAVRAEQNDASRRLTSPAAHVRRLARKVTKHHEPINQINTSRTERVKKVRVGTFLLLTPSSYLQLCSLL